MQQVQVIQGSLLPERNFILVAINQLMMELKSNPAAFAAFQANPRLHLGARGFHHDVQRELLRDLQAQWGTLREDTQPSVCANSSGCGCQMWTSIHNSCFLTCVLTDCVITNPW